MRPEPAASSQARSMFGSAVASRSPARASLKPRACGQDSRSLPAQSWTIEDLRTNFWIHNRIQADERLCNPTNESKPYLHLAVDLRMRFEESTRKKKEEQDEDTVSIHSLGCTAFRPLEFDCESRSWFLNLQSSKIAPEVIVNLARKPLV